MNKVEKKNYYYDFQLRNLRERLEYLTDKKLELCPIFFGKVLYMYMNFNM